MEAIKKDLVEQHFLNKFVLPKESWIGWLSSLIEAYNMAIYSFLAPVLAQKMFQGIAAWKAVIFSYCLVFVGSSLLYPAGAIYYGFLGDKKGRQKICTYSTLGLGLATGMMGVLPIDFLGEWAWICFLMLIGLQYFFSGGEYHGSVIFSLEHLNERQSGLTSGVSCLFAVFGLLAANGLATIALLMENEWCVRCCFLLGGLGGIMSYTLKNYCQETPVFSELSRQSFEPINLWQFFKNERKKIGGVVLALAFFITSYSFIFIFLPLVHSEQIVSESFDTFKTFIVYGALLVLSGWFADLWGMRKVMMIGSGLFSLAIIPLCYLCHDLFTIQIILTAFACLVIGPIHSWMLNEFDPRERCRGIFISSAIAISLLGGSVVPLCLMIYEASASLVFCACYPLCFALGLFLYFARTSYYRIGL